MKICVIGNSHAGMLIQAINDRPSGDLDFTYFAKQGRGPAGAQMRGSVMHAKRRELRRTLKRLGMPLSVDLAAQDMFVVVAMSVSMFTIAAMTDRHAVWGWPSTGAETQEDALPDRPLMSSALLQAALADGIGQSLAYTMITRIRKVSDSPILFVPQPCPSETLLNQPGRCGAMQRLFRRKDGDRAAGALMQAHRQTIGSQPDVLIAQQPADTITGGCLTREAFSRDGVRLNLGGRHDERDILHANAAYGARVLDRIGELARRGVTTR